MLLAIPPGYVTAIWPASGIALGCLLVYGVYLWPGIFLGSMLVNLSVSAEVPSALALASALPVPVGIGLGAAMQAVVGAVLIRRYIGFPTALNEDGDVIKFLLLGGPLACLINATWGGSTLLLSGAVTATDFPLTWWTWWAGDTIGVLIFTPLTLIGLASPRGAWRHRFSTVGAPLSLAFAVVVTMFYYTGSESWEVLAGALLFTGLLGAFLLAVTGRTARISGVADMRNEELLLAHFILDNASDAALGFDREGRVVYANKTSCRLLGYSHEEILKLSVPDFDPNASLEDFSGAWDRVSTSGAYMFETIYRTKDGTPVSVEVSLCFVQFGDEALVIGFSRDITRRKRIENSVSEQRNLFLQTINAAPLVISIKDKDLRFVYINDFSARRYDLRPEDFIGNKLDEVVNKEPELDDIRLTIDNDTKVIASGEPMSFREEIVMIGGAKANMMTSKTPVFDNNGEVAYVLTIALDITDQKNLEAQLQSAQRMQALGQLTGGIAHDFNNLLHVMIGNSEALESQIGDDEIARSRLLEIDRAVDRASSLTERLLAYSRQQTLLPLATDIAALIGGLEDMLRRTLGETIELGINHDPELWPAVIDQHQFENVLLNLAINARDAMPDGGTLSIVTGNDTLDMDFEDQDDTVARGDFVLVAIGDTGVGMPAEVLDKAFEPFFTTKDVGQGSGLGLSMVYGFAKQSKGHVSIDSEVGRGTTVKLYLPRSIQAPSEKAPAEEAREFDQASERVLVVEDEEKVREVSINFLQSQGYQVFEAATGREAIEILRQNTNFDLLFTDVILPGGMNGLETAEEAQKIQPQIKVLFTTGYTETAIVENGLPDTTVALINKPYRRAELLEKVRSILDSDDN